MLFYKGGQKRSSHAVSSAHLQIVRFLYQLSLTPNPAPSFLIWCSNLHRIDIYKKSIPILLPEIFKNSFFQKWPNSIQLNVKIFLHAIYLQKYVGLFSSTCGCDGRFQDLDTINWWIWDGEFWFLYQLWILWLQEL